MESGTFFEGVKPGGLTTSTEIRILLCYLLEYVGGKASREEIEEALLTEELVNYFALADSLAQLCALGLVKSEGMLYVLTDEGHTVAKTLARDVPRTVRDTAVRGVVRAQQYAAKQAAHHCEIIKSPHGGNRLVKCSIGDDAGSLFSMELYMPDDLTSEAVKNCFVENGDAVYKLVLAALTANTSLAQAALDQMNACEV